VKDMSTGKVEDSNLDEHGFLAVDRPKPLPETLQTDTQRLVRCFDGSTAASA